MQNKKDMVKEKSSIYPAYSIKEIINNFIKLIDNIGGKKVALSLIAKTIGVSETTKSFTRKVSAAKQYNLITRSNGAVELTQLAKKILYPTEQNTEQLYIQAFLTPPIYVKLVERYNNKALPNNDVLANILMEPEFGITKNVKDLVVKKFIENCEDLNLIHSGILVIEKSKATNEENIKETRKSSNENNENITEKEHYLNNDNAGYQTMTIPLINNKTIKILIPSNCEKEDYIFLKQYIDTVLPMYIEQLKNKK